MGVDDEPPEAKGGGTSPTAGPAKEGTAAARVPRVKRGTWHKARGTAGGRVGEAGEGAEPAGPEGMGPAGEGEEEGVEREGEGEEGGRVGVMARVADTASGVRGVIHDALRILD